MELVPFPSVEIPGIAGILKWEGWAGGGIVVSDSSELAVVLIGTEIVGEDGVADVLSVDKRVMLDRMWLSKEVDV